MAQQWIRSYILIPRIPYLRDLRVYFVLFVKVGTNLEVSYFEGRGGGGYFSYFSSLRLPPLLKKASAPYSPRLYGAERALIEKTYFQSAHNFVVVHCQLLHLMGKVACICNVPFSQKYQNDAISNFFSIYP